MCGGLFMGVPDRSRGVSEGITQDPGLHVVFVGEVAPLPGSELRFATMMLA